MADPPNASAISPTANEACRRLRRGGRARTGAWAKTGWLAAVAVLAASCGASAAAPITGTSVNVAYAGSLVRLIEQNLAPAFDSQSGERLVGYSGGSTELGHQIEANIRPVDVFVSASAAADRTLMADKKGPRCTWYVSFAQSPLVLAYNPHSRFAAQLRTRPWYRVIRQAGFLLGRTDPALDPKGRLTAEVVRRTAAATGDSALDQLLSNERGVYPENGLLGRLEAGQLDAGFFYEQEAKAAGLPTVTLTPMTLSATYTATIVTGARHRRAAVAFIEFLLGATGSRLLHDHGFVVLRPARFQGTGIPPLIKSAADGR